MRSWWTRFSACLSRRCRRRWEKAIRRKRSRNWWEDAMRFLRNVGWNSVFVWYCVVERVLRGRERCYISNGMSRVGIVCKSTYTIVWQKTIQGITNMSRIMIEIRNKQHKPILIASEKRGCLVSVSVGEFGTFLIVLYLKSKGIIRTTYGKWIRRDLEMLFFHATYISICRQEGHVGYKTHHGSLPWWQELTTSAWCYYQL